MHLKHRQLVGTLVIALVVLATTAAMGQARPVQTPSFNFEFRPRETGPLAGGGGPIYVIAMLDLRELEADLNGVHFVPDLGSNGGFLLHGGGGFGGEEIRIGGLRAGAIWTTRVENSSQFDEAQFALIYGGISIERLLGAQRQMAASAGALLGWGSFALELSQSVSGDFSEVTTSPNSVQLERSFYFAQPYLSAELKLLKFIGLQVTVGYWFSVSFSGWHLTSGQAVIGGPLTTLGMPVMQLMLVFGE